MSTIETRVAIERRIQETGKELFRLLARTYYDHLQCIVLAGLLALSPDGKRVKESDLVAELRMPPRFVSESLNKLQLGGALKLTSEQHDDESQSFAGSGGRAYTRKITVNFWEPDYELLVQVIKYRHDRILSKLEEPVRCPPPYEGSDLFMH